MARRGVCAVSNLEPPGAISRPHWLFTLGFLKSCIGPVFTWLNAKVDAGKQMHIVDSQTVATIAGGGQPALAKSDELKAQVRMKQGNWGPMTWFVVSGVAAPR